MSDHTKTSSLHRLTDTHLTVANPAEDVRGWRVVDREGNDIGKVTDLLVDDAHNKVRFLEVGSGGFLGLGEERFLLPIDAVTALEHETVHVDQTRERVRGAPRFDPELAAKDDRYWDQLYGYYGYTPYWGPGYVYPAYPYYPRG